MSTTAGSRPGVGPGRLDPTVRALLRGFLSPAVADRYASALQPIAVADRDAALSGAVSTLRARFAVPVVEIAVGLVEEAGLDVREVATMLAIPTGEVTAALALPAAPRVGAPADDNEVAGDETAMVEALLADLPTSRRPDPDGPGAPPADEEPIDVELATALPAHVGLPSLEARIAAADRRQRRAVNVIAVAVLLFVAVAVNATRTPTVTDDVAVPTLDATPDAAGDADGEQQPETPAPVPTPPAEDPSLPVGPPTIAEARFVDGIDPATGTPGATLTTAPVDGTVRLWVRLGQLPRADVVVSLQFVGPDGTATVRPVLLRERVPLVSVRLPDELGRRPGRYAATVTVEDAEPVTAEVVLEERPTDG